MSIITVRELTPMEESALSFIRSFEKLAEQKKLKASLYMTPKAFEVMKTEDVAKPLKADFDPSRNKYVVSFSLQEYKKYVDFAAESVGFTVQLDGSVITFDGLRLIDEEGK